MENLNIDYHVRILVLKALNKVPFKKYARELLGISEKTLFRLIRRFDIKKDPITKKYK